MQSKRASAFAVLVVLLAARTYAIQGYVLYSTPQGTYKTNLETNATTKLADWGGYAEIAVSPDGRQVAACGLWQADGGILVVNTDGTHDSTLLHGSDYTGAKPNKYSINTAGWTGTTYNYGLGRVCAFGPNGVYFVRCVGDWPDQSAKVLCYADRATGIVHTVLDISAVDDGHQAMFVSGNGRKVLSWCHSRTVAMDINATSDGGAYHYITGIWGHGPIIPNDGSVVIINDIRGSCDVLEDHRTWVVYDWTNGACGNFLYRYTSPSTSPTGTGTQAIVRGVTAQGERGEDYIAFGCDDGSAWLLNWRAGTAQRIPHFGDVFLGTLPVSDQPTLSVTPTAISFTASGSQNVTVRNIGGGTLTKVATSISYTNGSGWLTAVVQGTGGNTQTIANTVNTSSLAPGSYSATVSVSGGGASNPVSYTVTVNLSVPGNVSTSVSGARYRNVTVTWTDNSTGETGFSIERSYNGGAYSVVGTAGANATSFVDSNVTCNNGNSYSYRLRAAFSGGTYSGYSAPSSIVVDCVNWVDVTAPAAGAVYHFGDTVWIQWEAYGVGLVYIEGTLDGGDSMQQVSATGGIAPTTPGWGNYPWVPQLPPGADSTRAAFVRVAEYTNRQNVNDASGTFTVYGNLTGTRAATVRHAPTASGLKQKGLVSLAAVSHLVYSLKPGETGTIRIFAPNGTLVHTIACAEHGTHAVAWDSRSAPEATAGRGMYLVDMVVR